MPDSWWTSTTPGSCLVWLLIAAGDLLCLYGCYRLVRWWLFA